MSNALPLRYWCEACGGLMFRSDAGATGLIETVCKNRRCPDRRPRVLRVPEDARDHPRLVARLHNGAFAAQSA